MSRTVFVVAVLALVAVVGTGVGVGVYLNRAEGPAIELVRPTGLVGRSAAFEATVAAPRAELTALDAVIEQGGTVFPLFSLDDPAAGDVRQEGPDQIRISRSFDRQSHPDLRAGAATVRVSATRPILFGLRERSATVAVDVEVRLDPPRLAVASTFHYVNHGGSEMVVYTVSPPDAESGVRVGDRLYPGYPAAGMVDGAGENLRLAFFALEYDQDLGTPIELYATDAAGNEGSAQFDHRRFPRNFRRSRITVSDGFLRRVVPPIVSQVPELADEEPDGADEDWLDLYLFINGELRRRNRETLIELAAGTAPRMLWDGGFRQLANSQVESGFADHRTYLHEGEEVDQQVHLGFRPRVDGERADPGLQQRHGGARRLLRHLRQTASSSTTARGCRACTRTCRRSRCRRATRCSRASSSDAAARPAWPAATTCTSRCCCTGAPCRRSSGGIRTGSRTASCASCGAASGWRRVAPRGADRAASTAGGRAGRQERTRE